MFLVHSGLLCQSGDVGNWLMYFGQNRLAERWSLHTEIQYRSHAFTPDAEQLLLRTGINYFLQPKTFVTAGVGYISNHPQGNSIKGTLAREFRIWQQLIMLHTIGRFHVEHRYRAEQRWVESTYSGRLRYRLLSNFPLNTNSMQAGTVFLSVYDEIFLNTRGNYFDRNRFYTAIGYQWKSNLNTQAGMLNQALANRDKWYFQLAVFWNTDWRKQE